MAAAIGAPGVVPLAARQAERAAAVMSTERSRKALEINQRLIYLLNGVDLFWFCRVSDKKTSVDPSTRLRVTLDGFVLPMHKIGRQTTSYRCRRNGVVPSESCA